MDERIAIWNLLHDGEITAFSREGTTLTVFVSIPYLRRRVPPLGDSFVLTLRGLRKLEFRTFEDELSDLADELDVGSVEILETASESMPISISTTLGTLLLDFDGVQVALDTGQATDYATLDRICVEYWDEWERRAKENRQPSA